MELNDNRADALKEIINIGVGRAASTLNELLSSHIVLHVPSVNIYRESEFLESIKSDDSEKLSTVHLHFQGNLAGIALMAFPPGMAANLVAAVTEDDFDLIDFDSVRIATLCEIGNIILNGVTGSFANLLEQRLYYSLPQYREDCIDNMLLSAGNDPDDLIVVMQAHFSTEELSIEGDIMVLFEVTSFDSLFSIVDNFIDSI
ncbi:MAG: chemotaxis protein CheC [Deltaproteobacteria bacterium]|nr:chemotaxis protein CheC [Deltaproteobacteria bacterium]